MLERTVGAGEGAPGHIAALDGLRGLAIALVLWHHIPHLFGTRLYQLEFWRASAGGWLGVDLFFVVSGFLITSILLRTRGLPHAFRTFWARRALRIFPLYYLYLVVLAVTTTLTGWVQVDGAPPRGGLQWLAFPFYLANFQIARSEGQSDTFNLLWSLAIEEQFYLVWPVVTALCGGRQFIQVCLIGITLAPVARAAASLVLGLPGVYFLTLCRADTLLFGALLAALFHDPALRRAAAGACRRAAPLALAVLVATVAVPFHIVRPGYCPRYWVLFGYSWVGLCFMVLVGAAVTAGPRVTRLLTFRPLVYVGRISYGIYLWHYWVGEGLRTLLGRIAPRLLETPAAPLLWVCAVLLAATASWYGFERHFLKLKKWFRYDTSREESERNGQQPDDLRRLQ